MNVTVEPSASVCRVVYRPPDSATLSCRSLYASSLAVCSRFRSLRAATMALVAALAFSAALRPGDLASQLMDIEPLTLMVVFVT